MSDRARDVAMVEVFRDYPAYMVELLNSVLEDGDTGELPIALRLTFEVFGGVRHVAEQAGLNPNRLSRTPSA